MRLQDSVRKVWRKAYAGWAPVKTRALAAWRTQMHATEAFADVNVNLGEFSNYRAENFPSESERHPWLDGPHAEALVAERERLGTLSTSGAEACRSWMKNGFLSMPALFSGSELDALWAEYERSIATGHLPVSVEPKEPGDSLPGRHLNPHLRVRGIRNLLESPRICDRIRLLLGREALPYQTMTFYKGSQQMAHSDSIHMTSYPLGYLVGVWIAFEDVHPEAGPLFYHSGSHKLPYVLSAQVGIAQSDFDVQGYEAYEQSYIPRIQADIARAQIPEQRFLPRKGDVFLWHANLLHGGSARKNLALTRKSIVCHYYAKGAACYHDLSGKSIHS